MKDYILFSMNSKKDNKDEKVRDRCKVKEKVTGST